MPAEVRATYLLHDGQHSVGEAVTIGAIYGMEFLPLAEVARCCGAAVSGFRLNGTTCG